MSKKSLKLLACLVLTFIATTGISFAMRRGGSFFKVGKTKFRLIVDARDLSNAVGNNLTVSLVGSKGRKTGTMIFIFNELVDQIQEGAVFEITTSGNSEDGKVSVEFTSSNIKRSGRTILLASDSESTASGTVEIVSVDENGFTMKLRGRFQNVLRRVSNPLRGDFEGTDSRANRANVSAMVVTDAI